MGQTYAIDWSETAGDDDSYIVERSTSPQFTLNFEQQQVSASAASFVSASEGIYYHRVRAVAGCDPTKQSASSAPASVTVISGPPVVVITVQPAAAIIGVGGALDAVSSNMTIENIGRSDVVVSIGTETISSPSFFVVTDPSGGDVGRVALTPKVPKQLAIRFSGVSTSAAASYQGLISIRGVSASLAVTPYAYINLKIGASGNAVPTFRIAGIDTDYVSFPGYSPNSPDSARPPLRVEIFNPGDAPLDVGGEIAPEAWLVPNAGWNAAPIPPKSSSTVELTTDRSRAFAGSALPRYTYFTVRTKSGGSARLIVQDNDVLTQASGPLPAVSGTTRSFILARVAEVQGAGGTFFRTRLRLTNVSNTALRADLYFIPVSNPNAIHTVVVIPPNDVVALSDVLTQLFGVTSTATVGQIEIRTPTDDAGLLIVTAATYSSFGSVFHLPVILRGEGARAGRPHAISGVTNDTTYRAILTLVETTRISPCTVTITTFDSAGTQVLQLQVSIAAAQEIDLSLGALFPGSTTLKNGRLQISTDSNGAVATVLYLIENATSAAAAIYVSQPIAIQNPSPNPSAAAVLGSKYTVVGTVNGPIGGRDYRTLLGISAPPSGADLLLSYYSANFLANVSVRLSLGPGQTIEIPNVLKDLFQLPASLVSQGTISISATAPVNLYGRLLDTSFSGEHVAGNVPIISNLSEAITSFSAGFQRPIYFDGLEQSTDPNRGSRWSLSLSEINGATSLVTVRLYEPGNRTAPIAERDFEVNPREHKVLNTIFAEMGLDTPERRKDRTNVQVVVIPKSGYGAVVAVANGFDSTTGDVVRYLLTPNGGVAASGAIKVTAVPLPPPPPRRRSARH